MNAKLLVVLGAAIKREVTLQLPAVLGRSRKSDIKVPHPLVSRRHCELSEENGLVMLRVSYWWNFTAFGAIIILSVILSKVIENRRTAAAGGS